MVSKISCTFLVILLGLSYSQPVEYDLEYEVEAEPEKPVATQEEPTWFDVFSSALSDITSTTDLKNKKQQIQDSIQNGKQQFKKNTQEFTTDMSKSSLKLLTCYLDQVEDKEDIRTLVQQIREDIENEESVVLDSSIYGKAKKKCSGEVQNISEIVDLYYYKQSNLMNVVSGVSEKLIGFIGKFL